MLLLSVPLVGSHLAHALIGLTDTVMLGWYSIEALAAGALANSFFFTLFVVGSGFCPWWPPQPVPIIPLRSGGLHGWASGFL